MIESLKEWRNSLRLQVKVVYRNDGDGMTWWELKSGMFWVKSLYGYLMPWRYDPFPKYIVWNLWVPTKVWSFAWEATCRILTIDQLKKRGWTLVNGCFLYKDEEESANNLLLDCTKTRILWPSVFSLFGLERVMPASINGELLSWQGSFLGKRRKIVWWAIPLCIFWIV